MRESALTTRALQGDRRTGSGSRTCERRSHTRNTLARPARIRRAPRSARGRTGGTHRRPHPSAARAYARARRVELAGDRVPRHHVPPGREVVRAAVLVVQVVGVLPDVDAEDGRLALGERRVLVRRRHAPRGASPSQTSQLQPEPNRFTPASFDLLLELVERAERVVDRRREVARGLAARRPAP